MFKNTIASDFWKIFNLMHHLKRLKILILLIYEDGLLSIV